MILMGVSPYLDLQLNNCPFYYTKIYKIFKCSFERDHNYKLR